MYDYLKGTLQEITPLYAVLDIGGIGYKLYVPVNLMGNTPAIGESCLLYTSWVVRELSQTLYGFLHRGERELFELLISLSGIGPKTALSLIGHLSMAELTQAVHTHNSGLLTKVPGIGKKTAERLLIDLKDKSFSAPSGNRGRLSDAAAALINLGYSQAMAEKALKLAADEGVDPHNLPLLITTALRLHKKH